MMNCNNVQDIFSLILEDEAIFTGDTILPD